MCVCVRNAGDEEEEEEGGGVWAFEGRKGAELWLARSGRPDGRPVLSSCGQPRCEARQLATPDDHHNLEADVRQSGLNIVRRQPFSRSHSPSSCTSFLPNQLISKKKTFYFFPTHTQRDGSPTCPSAHHPIQSLKQSKCCAARLCRPLRV